MESSMVVPWAPLEIAAHKKYVFARPGPFGPARLDPFGPAHLGSSPGAFGMGLGWAFWTGVAVGGWRSGEKDREEDIWGGEGTNYISVLRWGKGGWRGEGEEKIEEE